MKKLILFLFLILSGLSSFSQTAIKTSTTPTQLTAGNGTVVVKSGTTNVNVTTTVTSIPSVSVTTGTISVGGFTVKLLNTITTSASPDYATGDNVGAINTLTSAARSSGGSGAIQDLIIWDKDAQSPNLVIDYWDTSPSGTFTDNAAEVIAGDHAIWLGSISINASDWITQGAITRVTISNIGIRFKSVGSANIYFTISTTSTINASSTSEFVLRHGIVQD